MHVIHLPFCYYPDSVGGTEVYVASLARESIAMGITTSVAVADSRKHRYVHDGIPVRRFVANFDIADPSELYNQGDPVAADEFGRLLDEERPDIVHLHAFTRQVSLLMVRQAKARAIPVLFTYHTPTVSCQRGTMMHRGKLPCNGLMELHTCARCTLQGLGLNRFVSDVVGSLPKEFGAWLAEHNLRGGLWTALRLTELLQARHDTVRALFDEVDRVVAVCDWVQKTMQANGVPESKITLCRQGFAGNPTEIASNVVPIMQPPLKVAYFGRLDPVKGLDLLIRAVQAIPDVMVQLDIYGISQGKAGERYSAYLSNLAQRDQRIRFYPPADTNSVVSILQNYHVLAVPSLWLETGPLVVLEAFAAGLPVLGSRRGGISELVRDGVNGLLVEPDRVDHWSAVLRTLANNPNLLARLRRGVSAPLTMRGVAATMISIYQALLTKAAATR